MFFSLTLAPEWQTLTHLHTGGRIISYARRSRVGLCSNPRFTGRHFRLQTSLNIILLDRRLAVWCVRWTIEKWKKTPSQMPQGLLYCLAFKDLSRNLGIICNFVRVNCQDRLMYTTDTIRYSYFQFSLRVSCELHIKLITKSKWSGLLAMLVPSSSHYKL